MHWKQQFYDYKKVIHVFFRFISFYWTLLEVKLPYEPSCPSVGRSFGRSVCLSVGLSWLQVSLPMLLSEHSFIFRYFGGKALSKILMQVFPPHSARGSSAVTSSLSPLPSVRPSVLSLIMRFVPPAARSATQSLTLLFWILQKAKDILNP